MSRMLKGYMRDEITSKFNGVDGGLLISTQGLNSEKTYALRSALQSRNLRYVVLRNSLARHAFVSLGYDGDALNKVLEGPCGIVYTSEEGSAALAAKAIDEWKREAKDKLVLLKGALLDGQVVDAKDAAGLKDAPTKDQARAMLLGTLQAGATKLLGTIREPLAGIVYVLNNYHEKKEGA